MLFPNHHFTRSLEHLSVLELIETRFIFALRLASSLLQQKQVADRPPKPPRTDLQQQQAAFGAQQQSAIATTSSLQQPAVTPEIQSSIKEVTSAIVHYVNDQTSRHTPRSRSVSPSQRYVGNSTIV